MKPERYSSPFFDWQINREAGELHSPPKESGSNQLLLCDTKMKDGAISARISPIAGLKDENWGYETCEGNMVFRYSDPKHFYCAGIGGFGRKFFIGKVDSEWHLLEGSGVAQSLSPGTSYDLKVEFRGDLITLYHDTIPVVSAKDSTYAFGHCGFRANRTDVHFSEINLTIVPPVCFVIMPFARELNYVHKVIQQAAETQGFKCVRADQRFISEPIMEDVKTQIAKADLLIVDFTGKNPNVYFEAGLADAWKKKWIVIAQSNDDLAFDVAHVRALIYSNRMGAEENLKDDLIRAFEAIMSGS